MSEYDNAPVVEVDPTKDANDNKLMGILCYLGILWLVPLLTKKHEESPFTKFHLNQGLLLSVFGFGGSIALNIVSSILSFVPVFGLIMMLVGLALSITTFVFFIIGIINAAKGEMKPLPLIGGLYTFFK